MRPVDDQPYRVNKYDPYKLEINITNIGFSNGIKFIDISGFEISNSTLSINIFEFSTDEDNDYKLIPSYVS